MCRIVRVAMEIIIKSKEMNFDIDYFKVQKLAYICQCVHYGIYKVPLSPETIWNWSNGGGFREIFAFFYKNLNSPYHEISIKKVKQLRDGETGGLLLFEGRTINFVLTNYASKSLDELIQLILEDPWYNQIDKGSVVNLEYLNNYFISQEQIDTIYEEL